MDTCDKELQEQMEHFDKVWLELQNYYDITLKIRADLLQLRATSEEHLQKLNIIWKEQYEDKDGPVQGNERASWLLEKQEVVHKLLITENKIYECNYILGETNRLYSTEINQEKIENWNKFILDFDIVSRETMTFLKSLWIKQVGIQSDKISLTEKVNSNLLNIISESKKCLETRDISSLNNISENLRSIKAELETETKQNARNFLKWLSEKPSVTDQSITVESVISHSEININNQDGIFENHNNTSEEEYSSDDSSLNLELNHLDSFSGNPMNFETYELSNISDSELEELSNVLSDFDEEYLNNEYAGSEEENHLNDF